MSPGGRDGHIDSSPGTEGLLGITWDIEFGEKQALFPVDAWVSAKASAIRHAVSESLDMKSLFDTERVASVTQRLDALRPDSPRQWGTMSAPQMLAHCAIGFETALGDRRPPRMFVGRIMGGFVKSRVFANDAPFRRNSPTAPFMVIAEVRELETERSRVRALIDRFTAAGRAGCTTHPHTFFGRLTPDQWGVLMFKHLDHHFRQFGV